MRLRAIILVASALGATAFAPQIASASSNTAGGYWGCGRVGSATAPAPGVGNTTTRQAAYGGQDAGSVTLLQPSLHSLEVQSDAPATGWVYRLDGTGVPVRVQFVEKDNTQLRFTYRLNSAGTKFTTVTVDCTYTP
jgi:hypothetical protein